MVEHNKQVKNAGRPKPPAAGMGRKKGTPNKTTALLKDAIIMAAEATGSDTKGKDGLVGYCKFLAQCEPKAFASLMGRVLPTQVEGTGDNGEIVFQTIYQSAPKS
jgi:hypothetical protein